VNIKAIEFLINEEAYPSGVGFMGFPKSISVAPNDILCHGIPDTRPLQGKLINNSQMGIMSI
jgi:methionyl aminopeptidase